MKKLFAVVAILFLIGFASLYAKENRRKSLIVKESALPAVNLTAEDVRASLKSEGKSPLSDLLGKDSATANEVRIPVTLKLTKEGKGWKVSGIELSSDEGSESKPVQPNVLGVTLAPNAVAAVAPKAPLVQPKSPEHLAAYAIYFLANGSAIGAKGNETVAAISAQAKDPKVKEVVLRGYSEFDIADSDGRSVAGKRAEAVKVALEKSGVEPTKIRIDTVGASPNGDTPKQKRRVEVVLQ